MRHILIVLIIFSFPLISLSQKNFWRPGESEVKVFYHDIKDPLKFSQLHLSGEFHKDHAVVYATPEEMQRMEQMGVSYEVLIRDLNTYYAGFWNSDVPTGYYEYQDIIDIADSLALHFPGICQKTVIGNSPGGRQLAVLKISDNAAVDENEPEVFFDAGIHGDEIGGPENLIRFARELCLSYGITMSISDLIDSREIFLLLMVNPDGRVNMSRYNNNGVDLNRDWGYMWDEEGGSPSEFSQQESKLLRDFVFDHEFVVHTTYHSGTEIISYPWSYRANSCPDQSHIDFLASVYSSESGYANLEYAQGFSGMYPINGSTKDANYGIQGSVSWSMEISMEKQPPASQIAYYYNINKPSMLAMIEYAGYGIEGTVTDALSGDPVPAVIFVNSYMQAYNDPDVGDFHKYVLPGTYSVTVSANGYESQTVNNVTVNPESSVTVDFQLQPVNGPYIYKLWSSCIPGNNSSDEGNTKAIFGMPDNVNYSIGKDGRIVFDMQEPVIDGPGNDLRIYEGDSSPETYTCYAGISPDGPWVNIGNGTGTSDFDFAGLISEAQFIKIVDDGDGNQVVADAGFDLDAAEALEHVSGVYLSVVGYLIDDTSTGNGDGILDPGEHANLVVNVRNNGDISATDIEGELISSDPYLTIVSSNFNFGNLSQYETAQGVFNVEADLLTPEGHPASLDLNMSSNSGSYNHTSNMTLVIGFVPEYCSASGGCDEYIQRVQFGTIDNSSACNGYYDYTDIQTDVNPGSSYPITVTVGTPYSSDQLAAFADWNYDGDFDDAGESFPLTWNNPTATGFITVPEGVIPRKVTIRIRLTYSSTPTPCGTTSYGEVEDYSLNIIPLITQGGTLNASSSMICLGSSTGDMTLTFYSGTITDWERRFNGGSWESLGVTTNSYSEVPSLSGNWDYRVEVDNGEAYSNIVTVAVNPLTIAGSVTGGVDVCLGGTTGIMSLSGYTGNIQRWQKQLNNGTWTNISNTLNTYNEIPSLPGTWTYRAVVKSGVCSEEVSEADTLFVFPVAVSGTAVADEDVICTGSPANLTLLSYEGTIQWEFSENGSDWSTIEGAVLDTYTSTELTGDTWFRAIVSLGDCESAVSNIVAIDVLEDPIALYTYEAENQMLTFTNTSTNADSYSWDFGDGNTSIEENPIHVYLEGGDYTVTLTASNEVCPDANFSQIITVIFVGIDLPENVYMVAPNPSDGKFYLLNQGALDSHISIFNLDGRILYEFLFRNTINEIDLSSLQKGVYFMKIQFGKDTVIKKIEIQ
jgi:hypothetical protein